MKIHNNGRLTPLRGLVVAVRRRSCGVVVELFGIKKAVEDTVAVTRMPLHLKHSGNTIMFDNGKQVTGHEIVAVALQANIYFAHSCRT